MTHPLDEALAEARRALELDRQIVAKAEAMGIKVPDHDRALRDRFVERWTRIEKTLLEAIVRTPDWKP